MARIRSVKPELRTSEVVASWPLEVRYFFVLLWGYLDDKGRGLDVPKAIAGDCFPHDEAITAVKIGKWLDLMATTVKDEKPAPICRYEVGGRRYLHCVNWGEHQRPNRPSPSRLPPCPIHEGLTEPLTEPLSESPPGDSLPGAAEQRSRGIRQQQQPRSEPRGGRLSAADATIARHTAAAAIILEATDATPDEANALASWIDRERRPRNLVGLVNALSRGPDLAAMLTDQRDRTGRGDTAAAIARARSGPACEHGEPGGAFPHPLTGQPLCPLCRLAANGGGGA